MNSQSDILVSKVDDKWRVSVPPEHRPQLGAEFWLFLDESRFLALVTVQRWLTIKERIDQARVVNKADRAVQNALRRLSHYSAKATADSSGRFVIPARLRAKCGLEPNMQAVFVEFPDRLALMSRDRYLNELDPQLEDDDTLAAQGEFLAGA